MLLDEPFAGIDPLAILDIQSIVGQLKERGIGILITDHNVRETLGICDRAYILNDGAVLEEGTPQDDRVPAGAPVNSISESVSRCRPPWHSKPDSIRDSASSW